ncbi:MAG: hypothetical protein WBB36_12605, partial [Chitinophagales bacterium]
SSIGADEVTDRIAGSDSFYKFHHITIVAPGTAKVKHLLTGIEKTATTISNQAGESDILFDLSQMPLGKCKLLINNVEKDIFYHAGSDRPQHVFGIIELVLSNLLDANYRIIETDQSLSPVRPYYKVLFPNRPTLWRYTVELSSNSPLFLQIKSIIDPVEKADFINGLNITSNDTGIMFTKTYSSPDYKKFQFVSANAVLLREKYYSSSSPTNENLILSLKAWTGTTDETSLKSDLQIPSSGNIDALNDPLIYSDILLTI